MSSNRLSLLTNPTSGGGGSTNPGGSDTQVQFNDGGNFGGDAGLVYNKTTDTLTLGNLTLTTDLPVTEGGTGASTAADARTNLGLAIGTNVQAYDADLAAIAALASNGIIARTGSGTASVRTITGTANQVVVSNGDGVSGNPTLSTPQDIATTSNPTFNDLTVDKVTFNETASFDAEVDNGNSGTADTIDWRVGNKQKSTVNGNVTYTFTAPAGPCNLIFKMVHEASATSYTRTWPATVKWPSGTPPTWTQTSGAVDIVSFYYDGTNYYAQGALAFA